MIYIQVDFLAALCKTTPYIDPILNLKDWTRNKEWQLKN